jgi:DNA-binding CsgD family transcriptional regulator
VNDAEWFRSEYYNEVYRTSGFGDACLLAVERHEETLDESVSPSVHYSLFTMYRRPDMPPFGEAELKFMDQLYPYLRRAAELHRRLSGERGLAQASMEALDRLTVGAFLLGKDGTILHASASAEEMVRLKDGLSVRKGRLVGMDERVSLRLATAIARTTIDLTLEVPPAGETVALARPSGKPAWMVTVVPLPRNDRRRFDIVPAASLAIATDPDARVASPADLLQAAFELTPAEARVALALANGLSPNEVAENHGTRLHTVRTQIKQLHDKMGVRNYSELICRLLQGLGPVRHEALRASD